MSNEMMEDYNYLRKEAMKRSRDLKFTEISLLVKDEIERQVEKFGQQEHDPFKYLAILGEEVGECNNAAIESYNFLLANDWDAEKLKHLRGELIQVAAVAFSFIGCLDRNIWANSGCGIKEK